MDIFYEQDIFIILNNKAIYILYFIMVNGCVVYKFIKLHVYIESVLYYIGKIYGIL